MISEWSDAGAAEYVARYGVRWGEDLALRTYGARLLGSDDRLVLHGGGNCSVKTIFSNILGENLPAIFVKASGCDMASMEPDAYTPLDLEYLRKLRGLGHLSDDDMVNELHIRMLRSHAASPSIETLVHAFIPEKYVDHTHADAILALTNQACGEDRVKEALGDGVLVLKYVKPGFALAKAAAAAYDSAPESRAMVWMRHGLVTWGETARESYDRMIELVNRAEGYLARNAKSPLVAVRATPIETARLRLRRVAPIIRACLARQTEDPDDPYERVILQSLIDRDTLNFLDSDRGREYAFTPPLTSDHLIRTKSLPLWLEHPDYEDAAHLRCQLEAEIQRYTQMYRAYVDRHKSQLPDAAPPPDPFPRVVLLPGLGAVCAGKTATAASVARDITAHTLAVKADIAAMRGRYQGLEEGDIFDMEFSIFQRAKLGSAKDGPLERRVAIITGAAGAIGTAIAEEFLTAGCHVALTDLPGPNLHGAADEFRARFGNRVMACGLDVTEPESVAGGFGDVIEQWGGVDLVIVNAGIAMVSSLSEMNLEAFRRLERVNVEGTLLVLSEAARHFRLQGTCGDLILVSTKNVFSPGARFGAYSATKTAAHQLARIASLEFAEIGVRVNMVAPDAVFAHGSRRSGLWDEVGPDRMKARGLDARGLEEYYRSRNLLKARVTARHVARAALFFATHQTPTTGATIPVDGGLPDATPR
jgi:rhamnose utilization protein RhaD (predicted bifunctional aldolase and dehydrogenase)/NAD(P)-dependent dehydrogenase (short-subunit alcohol dehydrogenase family)